MIELNKLYCAEAVEFMKNNIPNNYIDLTVTSPPYDNLRTYNGYDFDFESMVKELYRVTKEGGVLVWVVGDATIKGSETGTSFRQALRFVGSGIDKKDERAIKYISNIISLDISNEEKINLIHSYYYIRQQTNQFEKYGFNLHDTMIYRKNSLTFPDTNRYYQCFEFMFIISKGKPKTVNLIKDKINKQANKIITGNYRDIDGSLKEMSGSKNKRVIKKYGVRWNIWDYNTGWKHSYSEDYLRGHPAIFPEQLAHDHIISWSNENDIILDPMCGSGTTLKMAKQLNRNYIGIDISQKYIDIAEQRLNKI